VSNNLDLRIATLKVEQSQAQYRITRSAIYPGLDATASFTRSHNAGHSGNTWSASLGNTAYEVDLFGRVRSLNQKNLESFFATEEACRSARISLVAQVARQYLALRHAELQLKLARETYESVEASLRVNRNLVDAGASNELDLRTAEGQVQQARLKILEFERGVAEAKDALFPLLGQTLPETIPDPMDSDFEESIEEVSAGLPSDLAQRRPDILEAEHQLKSANANVGAARAAFFPKITLTQDEGVSSSELQKLFSAGTGFWSLTPQVSLPILTGGRTRANLDSARTEVAIEVANYQKTIQTAFQEVSDAVTEAGSYRTELGVRNAQVKTQAARFELAEARYRHGEDAYLNVLSAQQDLYGAQRGLLDTWLSLLNSRVTLFKALGGGWK
jgi:multidrug efflux system outer membrane protein